MIVRFRSWRICALLFLLSGFILTATVEGRFRRRRGSNFRQQRSAEKDAGPDFYAELGVQRHASTSDIKRAFRKLSLRFHPDRNPNDAEAADKFLKANRAYEVLSDDEKRRAYDNGGEEGVKQHEASKSTHGGGGFNPFASLFGQQSHGGAEDSEKRGPDVDSLVFATMADLYIGKVFDIAVVRQSLCDHCFGSGADSDKHVHKCRHCGGRGVVLEKRQIGPGFIQQVQRECPRCNGKGKTVAQKCHVCHGSGVSETRRWLSVDLLPGTADSQRIELDHEWDEFPQMNAGHLWFTVQTIEGGPMKLRKSVRERMQMRDLHAHWRAFRRDTKKPEDLHYYMQINLLQALVGYKLEILHFDQHFVELQFEGVTQPDSVRVVRGEGMPVLHSFPQRFGDLHVHFRIDFPKQISPSQRPALEAIDWGSQQ